MKTKIKELREKAGMTQKEHAAALGITQQSVYYYESGERDIKASVLIEMAAALNCTVSELLGLGEAEIVLPSNSRGEYHVVPLYGEIAAGTPIEMTTIAKTVEVPSDIRVKYPNAFLLRVEGNSMNRVLPNGCYALVKPCECVDADGAPYAVCVNGYAATIKRVRRLNNGFELVPDSTDPTYKPKVYDYGEDGTETVTVIGRVVWYCVPTDWEF